MPQKDKSKTSKSTTDKTTKKTVKKAAAKKVAAEKVAAKKVPAKKVAAKKVAAEKVAADKIVAKSPKQTASKSPAKKSETNIAPIDDKNIVSSTWMRPIPKCTSVPKKADVVIIGGGIIGISTAWFLAIKGIKAVVCEKGLISCEQSSRNWGWVRKQGRDQRELPMMIESHNIWKNIAREIEDDVGLVQGGCMFTANDKAQLEKYRGWVDIAKKFGLDTKIVQGEELDKIVKGGSSKWLGALYTASDCRSEPHKATRAIAKAAAAKGATILEGCAVRGLEYANGAVSGVVTEAGTIETSTVVCAAGAWSSLFCGSLGINIPQLRVRCTVARTSPAAKILDGNLYDDNIAVRLREDGGYSVAHSFIVDHTITPASFNNMFKFLPALAKSFKSLRLTIGKDFIDELKTPKKWPLNEVSPFEKMRVLNPPPNPNRLAYIEKNLGKYFPDLKDVKIIEAWAGMIDTTPDIVPIIEKSLQIPGLILATGFSGHGFGIGPGAGKQVAALVMGDEPEVNLSAFKLGRFFDGSKINIDPYSGI